MITIGRKKNRSVSNVDIKNVSGFEIVRLNIREMQKDEVKFSMTKTNLNSNKITIRSSEVVRIVTAFNPDTLFSDGSKYPFIKDLIVLKIGKSYKSYYENLCEERKENKDIGVFSLEILDIDAEGNRSVVETIRYKRLLCGSSFVRNQKELYIRETLYDKVMEVLLTGIEPNSEFRADKVAKYSTYLGLSATDSKVVSMPNICVVKDFKKDIKNGLKTEEEFKNWIEKTRKK